MYRFRYRVINNIGFSNWSPESYLIPAIVPQAPLQIKYIYSSNSQIVLNLQRSQDDGGLPITDY